MSFALRRLPMWIMVAAVVVSAGAQTATKPAIQAQPLKTYCLRDLGFCFQYPSAWLVLGEVYGGNGVVVAPQQQGDRERWDAVTVALVIPPPDGDEEAISLDEVIAQAVKGVRDSGQTFETLQRQQRTIRDMPAQVVKVGYTDRADGREWVEDLAFIQGPDSEIYSLDLKCAPASLAKLEPAFLHTLESFSLQTGATGKGSAVAKPKEGVAPPKTAPPRSPTTPKF